VLVFIIPVSALYTVNIGQYTNCCLPLFVCLRAIYLHEKYVLLFFDFCWLVKDPGITLLRYDRNADGLTSEKWTMYDHNADENGQKFRHVRYCVGTNGTVGWEVRSTMGTNVVNLGRQIFI
jgi:hypothetical protein